MTESTTPLNDDVIGAVTGSSTQADPLAELVGDGKKFATVNDLARGKLEADSFIEKIKAENNELRVLLKHTEGKISQAATVEDILKRVGSGSNTASDTPTANVPASNQPVGLTREDVVNLLAEKERQTKAESITPNTDVLNLTISPIEIGGKMIVRGEMELSDTNQTAFNNFFNAVYVPDFGGGS